MKKKYHQRLLLISLFLYLLLIILYKLDTSYFYRWFTLSLYYVILLLISANWILTLKNYQKHLKKIKSFSFLGIFIIAVITRFAFLINYPLVSLGDEVREPGLFAQRVVEGRIKDFFDYGAYAGYGLIIPATTSFFYSLIGSSVLVYRLPATIISIITILILYSLLMVLTKHKMVSFLGSMALVSMPLHLYYSRTELVVIISSLFSLLLLAILFLFFKRKAQNIHDYLFIGAIIGLTFNLYAALKAMSLIVIFVVLLRSLYGLFFEKMKFKKFIVSNFGFLLFIIIGFGPLIFNTNLDNFLNTKRLSVSDNQELQSSVLSLNTVSNVTEKYKKSLLVWISEPTRAWYPDKKPVLLPLSFALMILGIIIAIKSKNQYLITALVIFLALHLSNSALTDIINGDHRLSPLYPIATLFIGFGIAFLYKKIKLKSVQAIFSIVLFAHFSFQSVVFFTNQPANLNKDTGDYLSTHIITFLKSNKTLFNEVDNLSLVLSPANHQKFGILHYQEQREFFLPWIDINLEQDNLIADNQVHIKHNKEVNFLEQVYVVECENSIYSCPIGYKENFYLYLDLPSNQN